MLACFHSNKTPAFNDVIPVIKNMWVCCLFVATREMLLSAGSQNIGAFARPLLPSCLPAGGGSAGACIVWFTTAEGGAFYCVAKQYMGLSMFCLPTVGSWRVPHPLQRCQARGQPPVCSQRHRPQGVQEDTESGKWASQLLPPKGVNAQGATSDKIVACRNNARMKL